tara:strand:- start:40707 stop:41285 length:579 start_codon:yes stop_codon:yes gene_type:complete
MQKYIPTLTIFVIATIWGVFILDLVTPFSNFNSHGIRPRELSGLKGVLLSPFLHANLLHIISNTTAFIGSSILVIVSAGRRDLNLVFFSVLILSGIGTWLTSTAGVVVGLSGVIYGLIGFLFTFAIFHPSIRTWAAAFFSLILYSGAVLGLFKVSPYISWAGHFWGFVSGVVVAYALDKYRDGNSHKFHSGA